MTPYTGAKEPIRYGWVCSLNPKISGSGENTAPVAWLCLWLDVMQIIMVAPLAIMFVVADMVKEPWKDFHFGCGSYGQYR